MSIHRLSNRFMAITAAGVVAFTGCSPQADIGRDLMVSGREDGKCIQEGGPIRKGPGESYDRVTAPHDISPTPWDLAGFTIHKVEKRAIFDGGETYWWAQIGPERDNQYIPVSMAQMRKQGCHPQFRGKFSMLNLDEVNAKIDKEHRDGRSSWLKIE